MTLSSFTRAVLVAGCLLVTAALVAAEGGFTATLATKQMAGAGLDALSAPEREALDRLVADDLAYARREKLSELPGTFVGRHDEAARNQAGIDHLTAAQLARLNELVAAAIAARSVPKERPRLKESEVRAAKSRGEVHGSISVTYGWGPGGRDYRAGALWLDYYDPESRIGLGIGISTSEGGFGYHPDCFAGHHRGGYWPDYHDYDFHRAPIVFHGAHERADFRGGFAMNDGSCLRALPAGGFGGRGGRRR